MPDALLVLDIDLEIADQHNRAFGADALAAPRELAALHVALHDVDAILLIEGDAGDFVETDDIILADQAALPGRVVHEHLRDSRLAAVSIECHAATVGLRVAGAWQFGGSNARGWPKPGGTEIGAPKTKPLYRPEFRHRGNSW